MQNKTDDIDHEFEIAEQEFQQYIDDLNKNYNEMQSSIAKKRKIREWLGKDGADTSFYHLKMSPELRQRYNKLKDYAEE